jgi:uncharacterized protein VirK/YbjX
MNWHRRSTFSKSIAVLNSFICYPTEVTRLLFNENADLRRWLANNPQTLKLLAKPFLTTRWNARTRVDRIIDHFDTVREVGHPVLLSHSELVSLAQLTDTIYRLTLDQPLWILFEGPIAFSLWEDVDRIFHLSFCLSSQNGRRVAYVGGLQGLGEARALQRYRRFAELAGARPRDFVVEAFKIFCRSIGVSEIRAVPDMYVPGRAEDGDVRKLSFDEVWRERGGVLDEDGFYRLDPSPSRRSIESIVRKRRGRYRRRYAVLDGLQAQLTRLRSCCNDGKQIRN